jgi:biopolymer transport protein ExbD/biopolymer transport protein TolR
MAINVGGGGSGKHVQPSMNVTPLVDVVLVLLIIFMVITPLLTKKFWVHTPKQEKEEIKQEDLSKDQDPPLVLYVGADKKITVNGTEVGFEELSDRLKRMFAARDDHILFFDAHDDAEYGYTVEVMDKAREGGAVTIATLSTGLTSAPGEAGESTIPAPGAGAPAAAAPAPVAPPAPASP